MGWKPVNRALSGHSDASLAVRDSSLRIFSCRPLDHMLDYAPRPVDKDETLTIGVGSLVGGFSTFVDISV
jgi:hypothetical protein